MKGDPEAPVATPGPVGGEVPDPTRPPAPAPDTTGDVPTVPEPARPPAPAPETTGEVSTVPVPGRGLTAGGLLAGSASGAGREKTEETCRDSRAAKGRMVEKCIFARKRDVYVYGKK
jgi:hypothetical protein